MRLNIWRIIVSSAVLTQGWPIVGYSANSQEELSIERPSRTQDYQARRFLLRPGFAGDQGYQVYVHRMSWHGAVLTRATQQHTRS